MDFCGFQKILKESGIIRGSEEVQLMRTGCETPQFPHIKGLLLATTENSRTRGDKSYDHVAIKKML